MGFQEFLNECESGYLCMLLDAAIECVEGGTFVDESLDVARVDYGVDLVPLEFAIFGGFGILEDCSLVVGEPPSGQRVGIRLLFDGLLDGLEILHQGWSIGSFGLSSAFFHIMIIEFIIMVVWDIRYRVSDVFLGRGNQDWMNSIHQYQILIVYECSGDDITINQTTNTSDFHIIIEYYELHLK